MGSHNELKEINIKNHTCSHFNKMIKIEDFDFNNVLWDEKSYINILIDDIWQNLWLVQDHCVLGSIK